MDMPHAGTSSRVQRKVLAVRHAHLLHACLQLLLRYSFPVAVAAVGRHVLLLQQHRLLLQLLLQCRDLLPQLLHLRAAVTWLLQLLQLLLHRALQLACPVTCCSSCPFGFRQLLLQIKILALPGCCGLCQRMLQP